MIDTKFPNDNQIQEWVETTDTILGTVKALPEEAVFDLVIPPEYRMWAFAFFWSECRSKTYTHLVWKPDGFWYIR